MFVHLRTHTEFSIVDGICRVESLVKAAADDGQPALAVTDLNNLFGAIKFYRAARAAGVKPLIGAELVLTGWASDPGQTARVLVLAQGEVGYLHLCELLSLAWTNSGPRGQALCRLDWLRARSDGLVLLSGAQAGPVGQALVQGDEARAAELALQLAALFPHRFYLEVQRAGRPDDEAHVAAAARLAARLALPLVATHPVQFLAPEDFEAHDARVCIAEGDILGNPRRVRRFTPEQYFKTAAQMRALFADLPSAIDNAVQIARRCSLTLSLGKPRLPEYPTPGTTVQAFFREAAQQGLSRRLAQRWPDAQERTAQQPRYEERLRFETETILQMGFPGYFLIVADFINWARNNGCPVGPGRGSGAGSLVAWALGITDLDPIEYQLLFERFLNPERVSMPDFDIDFCQANRDKVIDYVKQRYGRDAVSQIATFGTMAARAAVRDVGRVLDLPYGLCDAVAKLIPNKPGQHITIAQALEQEPQLAERAAREEEVRQLLALAQKLEGLTRNVGMHAGGVLIAPGKLTDFCPLYQQPGSEAAVSQYDKDDVEAAGLVKFDFLGLATLTILEQARQMIRARHPHRADFDYAQLPLDDAATYRLFAEGRTEAVFQFESRGMQGMLREARPSRLEDLIALNALYRPGPMDLIPSFVARKHGREPVVVPHPLVEPVLAETYGIMVYQEQVMQVAQVLGGYSLGGADLLRRAMGKKKPEEMAKHRDIFRAGAASKGIPPQQADEIFDLMEKFAGYGFNKSHAAAYSLLAYHTGWLKVHHTAEFFCANMTVELDDTDKLKVLFDDARAMGLDFEPPDINRGTYGFEPVSDQRIRYGLGAVKGTGAQAIEAIVAARTGRGAGPFGGESGPFRSLFDFCRRVDRTRVNKRTVEALVKAGAFDSLHRDRAALLASVELAFEFAGRAEADAQQAGLFDVGDDGNAGHGASSHEPPLVQALPWGVKERLTHEKAAVGFHLSGHLFDEHAAEVRRFASRPLAQVQESREPALVAGIVTDLRTIQAANGRLILFKLDDGSAVLDASVEERHAVACREVLAEDALVIASARVRNDRFSGGLRLNLIEAWDLPTARCRFGKFLEVTVGGRLPDVGAIVREFPPRAQQTEHGQVERGLPVRMRLALHAPFGQISAQASLDERARFYPSDSALSAWAGQVGAGRVQVVYG